MTTDIRDVVEALLAAAPAAPVRLRLGAIVSVQAGGTATVTIGGSAVEIAGVKVLGSCCPKPGAACWLAVDGRDLFVLDHMAPTAVAHARVIRATSTQSIPASEWTVVAFNYVRSDPYSMLSSGTLVIPVPGVYVVNVSVQWANSTDGARNMYLYRNATIVGGDRILAHNSPHWTKTGAVLKCDQGDVLKASVFQTAAGAIAVNNSDTTFLSITWTGPGG